MKNIFKTFVVTLIAVLTLTGCGSSKSVAYTYNVETGDKVTVELDTTDDHGLTSKVPFDVYKDDKVLSTGTFIEGKLYDDYVNAIKATSTAIVIDEGKNENIEYIFYKADANGHMEYNYIISIKNSDTGLVLANVLDGDTAKEVFNKLTIKLAK